MVVTQGDDGDEMFIIKSGCVTVTQRREDGKEITVSWRADREPLIALYVRAAGAADRSQKCGAQLCARRYTTKSPGATGDIAC